MKATEDLVSELVVLVRGLRELASAVPEAESPRLELPAAGVLKHLEHAGPLRLSNLAEHLCLDLSTVSRQVPVLERAGWLVREPDPSDRRAQLLHLTPAGRTALAERRRAHARTLERVLPSWGEDDVAGLAALLARLNADLAAFRPSRDDAVVADRPPTGPPPPTPSTAGPDTPVPPSPRPTPVTTGTVNPRHRREAVPHSEAS